ncbi:aminopeptidase O-like isoform X2 [Argopecten irradians]|uniref:aminopeptidase O-like isoform X2 n=1 Tax=Argopecten irradians TaxID=31199 RepID=UPI003712E044
MMSYQEESDHENDLPLMSNVRDILVYHYILDLKCHLEDKTISGSVVVCCRPNRRDDTSCDSFCTDNKELVCQDTTKELSGNSHISNVSALTSLTSEITSNHKYSFGTQECNPSGFSFSDRSDSFANIDQFASSSECNTTAQTHRLGDINNECQNSEKERCVLDRKRMHFPSDEFEEITVAKKLLINKETFNEDDMCKDKHIPLDMSSCDHPTLSSDEMDNNSEFQMMLDCCDISILNVQDLTGCKEVLAQGKNDPFSKIQNWGNDANTNALKFIVEKNCLRVFKPGCSCVEDFPKIIKISFCTKPEGQSLKWTVDQDGQPCVYTHGNWINNRSLFPSQDVPVSMATWEAVVSVETSVTVVMSGDKDPISRTTEDGWTQFYFHTQMSMPSSTISLAIGHWCVSSLIDINSLSETEQKKTIPCRLFCASSMVAEARQEIGQYIGSCLRAAHDTLGPHPFQRLDIVMVPSSFDSLGMASPSMLYLSQSVLVGDFSMCVRIAHEVSHSWFGLAIGPSDWTEEWLTEGFCTYTEDIIHNLAMQTVGRWTLEYGYQHHGIRDFLRYRTLVAELEHTEEELQTLRPNKNEDQDESNIVYVKNGMNPDKRFMQVHYLKGYFLLRYLERKTGRNHFLCMMREYVKQFNGRLVSSQEVLSFFLGNCPKLQEAGITETVISSEWLDCPGIPKHLQNFQMDKDNAIANKVFRQVNGLTEISMYRASHKKKSLQLQERLTKMDAIQLSFVMVKLLKAKKDI